MFFYEYTLERIAEACEESGYDGIEFWIETPHYWIDRDLKRLKPLKKWTKSVHCAVLDLNPCSVNEMIQEITLKTNLHGINVAKIVNRPFTVHAGKRSAVREPVEEDYIANRRYFRILSEFGKLKGVELLLENSEPKINYLYKSFDEVTECAEKFDFGITFDIHHALKNGDAERYTESLHLIKNIHVSGFDSKGRHVGARFNDDVRRILEMFREAGYDRLITVELDDLGYGIMSFEDKIEELKREREFLEEMFRA